MCFAHRNRFYRNAYFPCPVYPFFARRCRSGNCHGRCSRHNAWFFSMDEHKGQQHDDSCYGAAFDGARSRLCSSLHQQLQDVLPQDRQTQRINCYGHPRFRLGFVLYSNHDDGRYALVPFSRHQTDALGRRNYRCISFCSFHLYYDSSAVSLQLRQRPGA